MNHDFVVSTCILHFIVQVKCKNSEALQRSVQSGGAPAPGAPLLPTPLIKCKLREELLIFVILKLI